MSTTEAPPRPPVPMDPRIKERRIKVRRDEGRRRLRVLVAIVSVLLVAGLAAGATRSPLLDVDRVLVTGAGRTSDTDAAAASGVLDRQIIDVDEAAAVRRLEALPWVDRAYVVRQWPATVRVRLTERKPVATLPAPGGRTALVDATGRVLAVEDRTPPGLANVAVDEPAGEPGSTVPEALAPALRVAAALPAALVPRVPAVVQRDGGELELAIDGGGVVRFGPAERVADKLTAVATVLDHLDPRTVAVLDVRVPGAPVVTRKAPKARGVAR